MRLAIISCSVFVLQLTTEHRYAQGKACQVTTGPSVRLDTWLNLFSEILWVPCTIESEI